MRLLLLIFLFCFSCFSLSGQENSSLLEQYSLRSSEIREQILRNYQEIIREGKEELQDIDPFIESDKYTSLSTLVAYAYVTKGNADSSLIWLEWMDDPAFKEFQYPARMIGLYVKAGIFQRTKIEVDGLKELLDAQRIAENYRDDFNQNIAMGYRGVAFLARGLERDGFALLEASIRELEKLGFMKHARNSQANLAAFYIRSGLYQNAIEALQELISLPEGEITDEFRSYSASNLALSFLRLGMLEEASIMIDKGLSVAESASFQLGILYALNLRMNYFLEVGEVEHAKSILDEITLRDSVNFLRKVQDLRAYHCLVKANYFEKLNDLGAAKLSYQEAIRYSVPGSKFPDFGAAFEGLHRVAIVNGDLQEATRVFAELNRIRDSLIADKTQVGLELYETESLLEIQAEKLENQQKELYTQNLYRQRLIVALVGISLLFIILFLVYRNKEMERARARTETSNLKLSEYTKELEELAFVVSHNLRESARNISTYTGLFSREVGNNLSSKGKTYLNFMYQASLRTSEMLSDLETYVGIGSHLPEGKAINLNQVWDNVLEAKKTEVDLTDIEIKKDKLPSIKGHSAMLELLFTELLDNSVKYRNGDSLRVTITYSQGDDCHKIRFSDDGIGFSERYKEKIFRVFQRLHSNEEIPGTGIGVPIIDKVVRLYGGKVEVESEEGNGTTFILMLPDSVIVG